MTHYNEANPEQAGQVVTVEFELDGQPLVAINGGPQFTFDEAVSLAVPCVDQAEADRYWDKLVEGGQESMCGWLKDRYGFSWQVYPVALEKLLNDPDPAACGSRHEGDVRHAADRPRRGRGSRRRYLGTSAEPERGARRLGIERRA